MEFALQDVSLVWTHNQWHFQERIVTARSDISRHSIGLAEPSVGLVRREW